MSGPLILEIKDNSLDDGPGIRSVVFFKGCPLDCAWCHNPESKKKGAELSFDGGQCIGCDNCVETCPSGAFSRANPCFVDREKCTLCFACEEACPAGALSRVGSCMPADEIVRHVIRDKPFFDTSGGGVTLSGGEPTLDMAFAHELMKKLKKEGVPILLETCGLFHYDRFMELIYPYADMIYCDIKLMDPHEHKRYCGVSNEAILNNFIRLNEAYRKGGIEILPRTPLIPDITDTTANISAIGEFYILNGVKRAALLSYNPLWHEKNRKIGVANPLSREKKMTAWLPKENEQRCRKILTDSGIELAPFPEA